MGNKLNKESKDILKKRINKIDHDIAFLEEDYVKLNKSLSKYQKKTREITQKIESLKKEKEKIKIDIEEEV